MLKKNDLTNQIFDLIHVDSPAPSKNGKTYWNCSCINCNAKKVIQGSHLITKSTRTVGCGCQILNDTTIKKERTCCICGKKFTIIDKGWTRKYCYDCVPINVTPAQKISIKRRAIKKTLVEYKGGKCERCGYNKCIRALEFHHINPDEKDFGISSRLDKTINELRAEVDKCILLCSNCHAEIHEELDMKLSK